MGTPSTSIFLVDIFVGNNSRNWTKFVGKFEWISMIDGGYNAKVQLIDPNFVFQNAIMTEEYFATARKKPLWVKFRIKWDSGESTPYRYGIVPDLKARGGNDNSGLFEFAIVDPISYYLSKGNGSGKVYEGKIGGRGGVIDQVLQDYIPASVSVNIGGADHILEFRRVISETTDLPTQYWMMRQDPRSFIVSLLDWTSSLTARQTAWHVISGVKEENNKIVFTISIREDYNERLIYPAQVAGGGQRDPLVFKYGSTEIQPVANILKWELLCDNLLVNLNARLTTSGLSAVSGEYLDAQTDINKQYIQVDDSRTANKSNATFGPDRGFEKPGDNDGGSTHIMAVPEFSAGEVGRQYREYIDGRARQIYIDMLQLLMRIKLTVRGEPRLHDTTDIGKSFCTLQWLRLADDVESGQFATSFLDGNWMIYGWHHIANQGSKSWITNVYLARLDYNASAKPGWTADSRKRN